MRNPPSAPLYDLFKLIVAILLLLLFLFLMFRVPSTQPPQSLLPTETPPPHLSTPTVAAVISTLTSTPAPPTATNTPQVTPSSTEPGEPIQYVPTPTQPPILEPTTPPIAENPPPAETVCLATTRTQLQVGMKAIIRRRLNFRSSAGIHNNRLSTNPPGTQVDVIGGPQCTMYENGSSYLWWQIQLPNGENGWSAEASAFGGFYFMEPSP